MSVGELGRGGGNAGVSSITKPVSACARRGGEGAGGARGTGMFATRSFVSLVYATGDRGGGAALRGGALARTSGTLVGVFLRTIRRGVSGPTNGIIQNKWRTVSPTSTCAGSASSVHVVGISPASVNAGGPPWTDATRSRSSRTRSMRWRGATSGRATKSSLVDPSCTGRVLTYEGTRSAPLTPSRLMISIATRRSDMTNHPRPRPVSSVASFVPRAPSRHSRARLQSARDRFVDEDPALRSGLPLEVSADRADAQGACQPAPPSQKNPRKNQGKNYRGPYCGQLDQGTMSA